MDIAYNKNNYHISSKTDLSHEETTNLLDEIYTKLYSSYAPVGVSELKNYLLILSVIGFLNIQIRNRKF